MFILIPDTSRRYLIATSRFLQPRKLEFFGSREISETRTFSKFANEDLSYRVESQLTILLLTLSFCCCCCFQDISRIESSYQKYTHEIDPTMSKDTLM